MPSSPPKSLVDRFAPSRRRALAIGLGIVAGWASWASLRGMARAAGPSVPARQQAELFAKAGKYDRRMQTRVVDGSLRVLVAQRRDDAESEEVALLFARRLREVGTIGETPIVIESTTITGAADLAPRLRTGDVAAVYVSTGLRSQIDALADSLRGVSVLTVAASPQYVAEGLVLGFDLVDGRPRLLVNLQCARAQGVDFHASFLKLAQIVT